MGQPKMIPAQRDFSMGEVDISLKRADESPVMKTGARQMANWRILSSGAVKNRPGRLAVLIEGGRVEPITMPGGQPFSIAFTPAGHIRIYNNAGTRVFDATANPVWPSLGSVSYAIIGLTIYIAYPGTQPLALVWDGVSQTSTWTLSFWAETVTTGNQKRTLFYRISPPNITMFPSATTGNITITMSSAVLVSGMIGTLMTFCGRQILITAVTLSDFTTPTAGPSQYGTATVQESLPAGQQLGIPASLVGIAFPGDAITGATSGAEGIITNVSATAISVQVIQKSSGQFAYFAASEIIVGPSWASPLTATVTTGNPGPVSIWEDEVMNSFRGWPSFVFADQNRLGFANFPSVPKGIAWSAISLPNDLYVGALADNAIFDLVPTTSTVLYVVPGMESSEFVFCDNAVFYIPITASIPLQPGSVAFNELSGFGALPNVQPRRAEQSIVFMMAGGAGVAAIQAPGAYYRPYIVDPISEMHSHLFTASLAVAIALPAAQTQFEERYIYIVLANGALVVGKYQMRQGLIEPGVDGKPKIGWAPWNGSGTVSWVGAISSVVLFTTSYAPNGVTPVSVVEQQDNNTLLDGALSVNNLPATFTPPGGKGPLYNFPGPNGTVFLFDLGGRPMGIYNIDGNGFLIPQGIDGENLSSSQLVAGQAWTATLEPFMPPAPPGPDQGQRIKKRRATRMTAYVSQSTGFLFARLMSGTIGPNLPALGTIMNTFRVDTYNQDDDPTKVPPLREEAFWWRPLGKSHDPRYAVIKDTPGSLMLHEIVFEATV